MNYLLLHYQQLRLYTIVSGSPTTANKVNSRNDAIELETGVYTNILGWYELIYDKHYQIY